MSIGESPPVWDDDGDIISALLLHCVRLILDLEAKRTDTQP